MKPLIPKEVKGPELSAHQIDELTNLIFLPRVDPKPCDSIFVFAGTHASHWEKAIEAYKKGYGRKIIVTGGVSPTGIKHPDWEDGNAPEADIILSKLLQNEVSPEDIVYENKSRNSLENVLFAKEVFDFSSVGSLMFVCKNHVAGRQYRTLAQHLPKHLQFIPFGFNADYQGTVVSRDGWMNSEVGRARVLGEYLRIVYFGGVGDILPLEKEIDGLEEYVRNNLQFL